MRLIKIVYHAAGYITAVFEVEGPNILTGEISLHYVTRTVTEAEARALEKEHWGMQ